MSQDNHIVVESVGRTSAAAWILSKKIASKMHKAKGTITPHNKSIFVIRKQSPAVITQNKQCQIIYQHSWPFIRQGHNKLHRKRPPSIQHGQILRRIFLNTYPSFIAENSNAVYKTAGAIPSAHIPLFILNLHIILQLYFLA